MIKEPAGASDPSPVIPISARDLKKNGIGTVMAGDNTNPFSRATAMLRGVHGASKHMQLKSYTDYSLRVLIYLGLHPERLVTIGEIAAVFRISRNHLMKVSQGLAALGCLRSVPGKKGGLALARAPQEINLGSVVRRMEGNFEIVECFNPESNSCRILPGCALRGILGEAMNGFLHFLDRYTLEDLLTNRGVLGGLTSPEPAPRPEPSR